jgi:hypothetical protein
VFYFDHYVPVEQERGKIHQVLEVVDEGLLGLIGENHDFIIRVEVILILVNVQELV